MQEVVRRQTRSSVASSRKEMDTRSSQDGVLGAAGLPRSVPDAMSYGPLFGTIPAAENAPSSSPPPYEELPSVQSRKLQLRKARFRGLVVPTRNITPTSARRSSVEVESPEQSFVSPFDHGFSERRRPRTTSNDLGILQEVSNSSLRRVKSLKRQDITTIFEPADDAITDQKQDSIFRTNEPELSPTRNTLRQPPRSQIANTPKRRGPRTSPKDNLDTETTKYIEHLESQLAALQTQLLALNSPSTTKTSSAKLRAMTSESRLLRQEVADWESKFHDRIKEQLEQHDFVVGNLKTQIKQLEKQIEVDSDKMKDLQAQSDDKTRQMVIVESANYDLERRLEFMSELLASSSGRIDIHQDAQSNASRRGNSKSRPRSVGPLRIPTPVLQQFSPQRQDRTRRQQDPTRTPELESPVHAGREENPFDRLGAHTRSLETSPEVASVVSENTLVDSVPLSPSSRRSVIFNQSINPLSQSVNSEHDGKSGRPVRRMRRFYTGSTGPRSLILPVTSHAGSFPPPASIPESPNPSLYMPPTPREGLGFKLPISPERPPMHKRSATWDDGESMSARVRRVSALPSAEEPASPIAYRVPPTVHEEPTSSFEPQMLAPEDDTPLFSDEDSAQLMANRAISLSSVRGRNLFDELSGMKHDEDNDNSRTYLTSSPFRNFSGPSSYAGSPTHDLEPGPQISPPSLPLAGPFTSANMAAKRSIIPSTSSTSPSSSPDSSTDTRPAGLIERLLSLISRTLDSSLPSVKTVVSNAWSMLSLSRPVLEFRFWLIKLLLGDLKKKHQHFLSLRHAADRAERTASSMAGVAPGTSAGSVGLGISHGKSIGLARANSLGRQNKLLDPFQDGQGSLRRRKRLPKTRIDDGISDDSDDPLTLDDIQEVGRNAHDAISGVSGAVTWLKFSMTMVFAVGVAIKDGPASLFTPRTACICGARDD